MKSLILTSLIFFTSNSLALTESQSINYGNLEKCFTSTRWGKSLDASVKNPPSAKYLDYEQVDFGSKKHFEPNLLIVPKANGSATDVHLIQYRKASGWTGKYVEYKPQTLRLNVPDYHTSCNDTAYIGNRIQIGGDCFHGPRENNNKCDMANLSISLSSQRSGSKLCTKLTRQKPQMNSQHRGKIHPLTLSDAADIAREAVIERLSFLAEQIQNGKLDTSKIKKNLTYAASGPCTQIFSGSSNSAVKAVSLTLLCKAEASHPECLQGDMNNFNDQTPATTSPKQINGVNQ